MSIGFVCNIFLNIGQAHRTTKNLREDCALRRFPYHFPYQFQNYTSKFTAIPHRKENSITNRIYSANRFHPMTIFRAPRFVIFVAGPVIMKAAALPMLMPSHSHC